MIKGVRLSLQLHDKKTETMYILQGNAVLEIEDLTSKITKAIKLEKTAALTLNRKLFTD